MVGTSARFRSGERVGSLAWEGHIANSAPAREDGRLAFVTTRPGVSAAPHDPELAVGSEGLSLESLRPLRVSRRAAAGEHPGVVLLRMRKPGPPTHPPVHG